MDVVLVSARPRGVAPHPRRARVERLAGELAAAGHRVRWLLPWPAADTTSAVPAPDGVEVSSVPGTPEPFAAVQDRLYDLDLERALVAWLRPDPPDVVHVDGFGGVSTYMSTWLAARLGVPSVVVGASRSDLLCHRGVLTQDGETPCESWLEPAQCFACCTTPRLSSPEGVDAPGEGLSAAAAFWARVTRGLGMLSRTPRLADFENRLDIIVHGLDVADVVLFEDQQTCDDLKAAGLPTRGVEVGAPTDVEGWIALYERTRTAHAGA